MSVGEIIAGDFPKGSQVIKSFGSIMLRPADKIMGIDITKDIKNIEIVTEETKKKFIGSAGWGLVGGLALGPLGLIAGILAGGNKKEILIACELKNDKRFIAIVDSKLYKNLLSVSY